jgi:hypothetical protein
MNSSSVLPGSCRLQAVKVRSDARGSLAAVEQADAGFPIERVYYIYGARPEAERGFHAHRELRQLAIAVAGSCTIDLDDGVRRACVSLSDPATGLVIGSMVWRVMRDFSPDCVLLVLASAAYEEADYIRSYDEFLAASGQRPR